MNQKFNAWLDLCRSIAIILVLLSHGRIFLIPIFPQAQWLKFGGFLGVELFFVLSGFLVGRIFIEKIEKNTHTVNWIISFWSRRWLRTYPSYILFLLLNIIFLYNIRPEHLPNIYRYLSFTQGIINPHPLFFGEAWSLSVEEIFYFFTPISYAIIFIVTKKHKTAFWFSVFILLTIPLALRTHAVFFRDLSFNDIRSTAIYRIDSIMIGVLFIFFLHRLNLFIFKLGTLFLCVLIYITAQKDSFLDSSMFLKIFLFPMTNFCFGCLLSLGYNWNIHSKITFISSRIARWSYSAYLTNLPILYLIKYIAPLKQNNYLYATEWLIYVTGTLLSAYIVYTHFEKKIFLFREKISPRK